MEGDVGVDVGRTGHWPDWLGTSWPGTEQVGGRTGITREGGRGRRFSGATAGAAGMAARRLHLSRNGDTINLLGIEGCQYFDLERNWLRDIHVH